MKEYIIRYRTLEGDMDSVIIEAYSKEDARVQLKREYWDVHEIISIREK
jgi:type II secretory pathway component PulF